jgi:beta-galactosidase
LRILKTLDPGRPVTYAANTGNVTSGINEIIPVRGFNYNLSGIDAYRATRPDQPVFGTEMGSTVTTRGIYATDSIKCYLTDFDENYPPWASTAEQWWTLAASRDWYMGGFVWTGFDYRGEPTPFQWPNISSHFGVMDVCGFPKNIYYYYQSWWTDGDVLHISPHWNWTGKENENIRVWVNSNAESVELFLNGKSLGRKEMPRNGHLNWDVKYRPGKLKAVARKGSRTFEKTVETTGDPYKIILSTPKPVLSANSQDATVINVSVKDKKGLDVPSASNLIHFSLSGNARIIGGGNGDPSSHEADQQQPQAYSRSLFNGHSQLLIQAGDIPGKITITAISPNLKMAEMVMSTQKQ